MKKTRPSEYRRGDVLWISCDPSVGAEPKKLRTCVVVSNDVANQFGGTVTVIPTQRYTTDRVARSYVVDLRLPRSNLETDRVANASMIMTYDRRRIVSSAGHIGDETLRLVDEALALHLGLTDIPSF